MLCELRKRRQVGPGAIVIVDIISIMSLASTRVSCFSRPLSALDSTSVSTRSPCCCQIVEILNTTTTRAIGQIHCDSLSLSLARAISSTQSAARVKSVSDLHLQAHTIQPPDIDKHRPPRCQYSIPASPTLFPAILVTYGASSCARSASVSSRSVTSARPRYWGGENTTGQPISMFLPSIRAMKTRRCADVNILECVREVAAVSPHDSTAACASQDDNNQAVGRRHRAAQGHDQRS